MPDGPGAQLAGDGSGALDIVGEHGCVEAVDRVVGQRHRVVFVVGRDHAEHRAEDLFAGDGRLVVDVAEDRRFDVVPTLEALGPAAAGRQRCPLGDAFRDVALDAVALAVHGERPHLGLRIEGIAHLDLREGAGQCLEELVVAGAADDDAGQRGANLPGEEALRAGDGSGGRLQVHVVEDDRGRLPTQLEGAARDAFTAEGGDTSPGGRGTGERDLVDARVAHQEFGDLAVRRHDVEDAGGQADVLGDLGEQVGVSRRLGGGLEDHGAPGDQRRRDLVGDEAERCVPRDDRSDHADRLTNEEAELPTHGRLGLLLEGERRGQARVVVEDSRHPAGCVLGEEEEGAGFARPELAGHVGLAPQALAHCPQILGPLRV